MTKLKGERAINHAINRWLRKYHFKARVRGLDTDFFWYNSSNTISYCFAQSEEASSQWELLLSELGLKYELSDFWTSLLHELGHSITWPSFTDEEIDECNDMKELLQKEDESSFAENVHSIYFHLPIELAATQWAVEFINTRPKAVEELTKMVAPKISRFYILNNIVA